MEIAPSDIAKGMKVYGTDGEKLGTVAEVYTGTPAETEAAGSGPGCAGLVEVATRDLHPNTTLHTVLVTGNDLPGSVGDNGILPGTTYYLEVITVTSAGTEVNDAGGKCYSVAVPASPT
jgi:hypothetical protein